MARPLLEPTVIRLATALALIALPWSTAASQSPAEKEVLASVQAFLAAMKAKDTVGMKLAIDSPTRFTLLRSTPNGSRVMTLSGAEFVRVVSDPTGPTYDEPIRKPVIQINGDLAHVWVEYQVRLEPGKVHHCGYDSFQMAKLGGRWRILNVSDTYTEEGCGAPWP